MSKSKRPFGLRAGTSLLAVYEWLRGVPATAQEVGDALHDKCCMERSGIAWMVDAEARRRWAARLLATLLKRGAVVKRASRGDGAERWAAVAPEGERR